MPTRFFIAAVAAISETIGCTSTMHMDMYHAADTHFNEWVKEQSLAVILKCANELKVKDEGLEDCELLDLLRGMVTEAPHLAGQRFVAVGIILAHQHKKLVDLAKKWFHHFILELHVMSSSRYTSEVSKDDPMTGWELRCRDGIKCPITGCIDLERLQDDIEPEVDEDLLDVIEVRYFINILPSNLTPGLKFAYDTLWAWANLTDDDWELKLYSPENVFFLASRHDIDHFSMSIVLEEKKETPNTYTARLMRGGVFSPNGDLSREVDSVP